MANQPLKAQDLMPFGLSLDEALVAASALGIFLIVWSIGQIFISHDRFAPRLKMIQERRAELKGELLGPTRRQRKKNDETLSFIRQVVHKLQLLKQLQIGQLQSTLINAGYRSKDAIMIYAFAKAVMPFLGLAIGFFAGNINWDRPFAMNQATGWLMVLGMGYLGARLPDILVANARQKRHHALRRGLPDALDLMMICAEAGLSLAAALDRVARELGRVNPELAEEFSLTSVELGFLPDRTVALKHLHDRADLPEIRGFVNVITQTEKYGTPIAQALRVLSKEFRTQRMLRAEQKAARLPAMMTVPMIVFILPTLFVIVMTPAVLSIMDNLK
jgi:tight adherence protein C